MNDIHAQELIARFENAVRSLPTRGHDPRCTAEYRAARSALSAALAVEAGTVGVKPLEWTEGVGLWTAQTQFVACYSVWEVDADKWRCSLLDGDFPTAYAAKAAAQEDYEACIRSALTTSPASSGDAPTPGSIRMLVHASGASTQASKEEAAMWDEILRLRAEVERLTRDMGAYIASAEDQHKRAKRATAEAMERAAQIAKDRAKSNERLALSYPEGSEGRRLTIERCKEDDQVAFAIEAAAIRASKDAGGGE